MNELNVFYYELGTHSDGSSEYPNLIFGSSDPAHRTVYFTPGLYEDYSYGVIYKLHHNNPMFQNIHEIRLYNSANDYMGSMTPRHNTDDPLQYFECELNGDFFTPGTNAIHAEVIDHAGNTFHTSKTYYV